MGQVSGQGLHASTASLVWEVLGDTINQFKMLEQCLLHLVHGVKNIFWHTSYISSIICVMS